MGAKRSEGFVPDYAVPPGETLLETIESLGLSQSDLAERTGRPRKTINEIINGKAAITPETAVQLERVLGVDASFWITLETNYRLALARLSERESLAHGESWLKEIPLRALIKAGHVVSKTTKMEQVEAALSFFGVASVDAWRGVWGGLESQVSFRKSPAYESGLGVVASWLRIGEVEARSVVVEPYDPVRFRAALIEIRSLTREINPEVFYPQLVTLCASAGVVVRFVPEMPKLRVCGATRWLGPNKALLQQTLRYKTNDHLWFTFFHEAGHILLHGKRSVFIEGTAPSSAARKPPQKSESPEIDRLLREETEANEFAADLLIPSAAYEQFVAEQNFSADAIQRFADQLGIAPGIVVGRLQHDEKVSYKSTLARLKVSYAWAA